MFASAVLVAGILLIGCASAMELNLGTGEIQIITGGTTTIDLVLAEVPSAGVGNYSLVIGTSGGTAAKITALAINPAFGGTYSFSNCGTYHVKMYVNYQGSSCKSVTYSLIDVYGPNAIAQTDTNKIVSQLQ